MNWSKKVDSRSKKSCTRTISIKRFKKGNKEAIKTPVQDRDGFTIGSRKLDSVIDKAGMRCIVHWGLPACITQYYQEIGRAGRDGSPANAVMFVGESDDHAHNSPAPRARC